MDKILAYLLVFIKCFEASIHTAPGICNPRQLEKFLNLSVNIRYFTELFNNFNILRLYDI